MSSGPSVVLVMGPPGAGKTSFLRRLHELLGSRSALISSSDIRVGIGALDLLSAAEKQMVTQEAVRATSRALADGTQYVFVDLNAFLRFQRLDLLAAGRAAFASVGLLRFEAASHEVLDGVRRKIASDPTYANHEGDAEGYVDAVAGWVEDVSEKEHFDMTVAIDVRSRRIVGDAFAIGDELGDALLDVLSSGSFDTSPLDGPFAERVVHEEVILKSPKFDVIASRVDVSDGGLETRTYARKRDYVGVIAISADGRILLTREFRSASASTSWGIPGGAREASEPVRVAAQREFAEESGYSSGRISLLYGEPSVSASILEMNWLFVAHDPTHTGQVGIDGSRIDLHWMEPRAVMSLLISGGFQDKVTAALLRYLAPWLSQALSLDHRKQ